MNEIFGTKLYSPQEARKFLGIGKNMIYSLIKRGVIEHVEYAGKFHITEDAIRQFLEKHTISTKRPHLYARSN
jgi:excisionase family DNA binding protein